MLRKKVLITVTTYPLPSRSYDELVCTAGVLEDGSWIRIYPVPFKFLSGLKSDGMLGTYKFTWIELNVRKRTDDFRPESYSPVNYDFADIQVGESIDIKGGEKAKQAAWRLRKMLCTQKLHLDLGQLIEASKAPNNISLATFKPKRHIAFEVEEDEREWKAEWREQLKQLEIFSHETGSSGPRKLIEKIPYKFFYRFEDCSGKQSRMMIEDWEIGQLYFTCQKKYGNEQVAIQKVREKYWDSFNLRDIHFFLGTTKQWHMRRSNNPFVIIGVFYPPHLPELVIKADTQYKLEL